MHRRSVVVAAGVALAGCSSDTPPVTDTDALNAAFLDRFNAMRADRGLETTTQSAVLTEMASAHAANMAEHDYLGHEQPDGTTIEDRFRERGLLPQCELPVPGSDRYYPGAENVAGAVESGRVTHPGTDETFYITGPDSLAEFVMDSWMTSPPHRDVMTLPAVREAGIGVGRNGEDLFVAVEFC
ncbi:MAG: secretory protein [Haloquadratum phage sp.]|nr:MAG: secretory protein [Haloquadratum phage sp.]